MFKVKKSMSKELKYENQVPPENIDEEIKIINRNQLKILELESTITEMKKSPKGSKDQYEHTE